MNELKFVRFFYQVIANGQSVICLENAEQAKDYVVGQLKGAEAIILPIAVFSYTER